MEKDNNELDVREYLQSVYGMNAQPRFLRFFGACENILLGGPAKVTNEICCINHKFEHIGNSDLLRYYAHDYLRGPNYDPLPTPCYSPFTSESESEYSASQDEERKLDGEERKSEPTEEEPSTAQWTIPKGGSGKRRNFERNGPRKSPASAANIDPPQAKKA